MSFTVASYIYVQFDIDRFSGVANVVDHIFFRTLFLDVRFAVYYLSTLFVQLGNRFLCISLQRKLNFNLRTNIFSNFILMSVWVNDEEVYHYKRRKEVFEEKLQRHNSE